MKKIDHIAHQVDDPRKAAEWYCENFGAEALYVAPFSTRVQIFFMIFRVNLVLRPLCSVFFSVSVMG